MVTCFINWFSSMAKYHSAILIKCSSTVYPGSVPSNGLIVVGSEQLQFVGSKGPSSFIIIYFNFL